MAIAYPIASESEGAGQTTVLHVGRIQHGCDDRRVIYRVGVVSAVLDAHGRCLLTMSDGAVERIDPALTDEEIKNRFELNRLTRMPKIDFCAGLLLDGPLEGTLSYAINELGHRSTHYLPRTPSDASPRTPPGSGLVYEVVKLSSTGQPAELRYVPSECQTE
jgi:hypothetical protein